MKTGLSAVKSGFIMFTIPFVFAIYPELLLIDKAVIDPLTGGFLDGYDGTVDWGWLSFLMARLGLALYLVSSALAGYDWKALKAPEIFIRLALAVLILSRPMDIYAPSILAGIALIIFHYVRSQTPAKVQS